MLNKICELSAERGKATLILQSKDEQIAKMEQHIEDQSKQLNSQSQQLQKLNAELRALKMSSGIEKGKIENINVP